MCQEEDKVLEAGFEHKTHCHKDPLSLPTLIAHLTSLGASDMIVAFFPFLNRFCSGVGKHASQQVMCLFLNTQMPSVDLLSFYYMPVTALDVRWRVRKENVFVYKIPT